MKEVIAMHGWSGDSNTWGHWSTHFKSKGWTWQNCERGYGNLQPKEPDWTKETLANGTHKKVLIAHSLGPHLLSQKLIQEASHIVFLCSFSTFLGRGEVSRTLACP